MKDDISGFIAEATALRDRYIAEGNKGAVRVSQQVLTLTEIYSKYDFSKAEFYGHLYTTIEGFKKIYEVYEVEEKVANEAVLELISKFRTG